MAYISKIKVPGVTEAYLIKDNEGRLMIAPAYSSSTSYATGDYYVKEGYLWKVTTGGIGDAVTGATTSVANELKSIKQSIAGAMHYIGITSTPLTDGSTITTLTPWPDRPNSLTKTSGFIAGDVVLAPVNDDKATEMFHEFVWNEYEWSRFGSINPIGKMAYANAATGSTTITYNKSKYTGTVSVNEYSERESNYIKPSSVVDSVEVSTTTSASSVSISDSKLVTTSVGVVGETGAAVTNITTTQKGLATTKIFGVGETGAALIDVTANTMRLGTTDIYGVEKDTVDASKVSVGSTTVRVGATNQTTVVTGLNVPQDAQGSNPLVDAQVDDDECLFWKESSIKVQQIREAAGTTFILDGIVLKSKDVTGIAQKANSTITVATGALVDKTEAGGDAVAISVTGTTDSFAKKGDNITVATGALVEGVTGDVIITSVTGDTEVFAKKAAEDVVVATGRISAGGSGDDVNTGISISSVTGLVTGLSVSNKEVLAQGTSGGTGAIKVLTGITSAAATKELNLTRTDITDTVAVTITVKPD